MAAEAKHLCDGREPAQRGCIEELDGGYRAHYHWREEGSQRDERGPRRAEKRRALEDLEAMRSAQSGIEQAAAQKSARAAEASRLQQQADVDWRVELFAQRQKEEQRSAQLQPPKPIAHQAIINTWACQNPRLAM